MYLEFYGLREAPFTITPNPRFLFFSAKHREAFNHLLYGIRERKGFVQLTGEVGAGKTTLCRAILDELGPSFSTAVILNPVLDANDLIKAIAMEYGLVVRGLERLELRPLRRNEIGQYVQHRLQTAGSTGGPFFTFPALWRLYTYSGGVPRLLNALCDKCLLAGFVHQTNVINFRLVGQAMRELEGHIEV
ncbi:MAG: AAA family ATPase [Verrucomicrobia bacterium]|nr:AAA family ATPase [Verrucomicrobiota bacterium]